ncbi:MAG: hypothetical protein LKJ69_06190 [Lactobacillus sp.]|jgi:hypothetical protein|nr:hypothetical protein [Lactobacillus sp.]
MKKGWIFILGLLVMLAGCSGPTFDQKAQLKQDSKSVITNVAKETATITTISNQVGDFPATFQTAYTADSNTDFQNVGAVSKLIAKRKTAYQQLEAAQVQIETITTRLTKLRSQNNTNLPQDEIRDLLTDLRLAKLDHKTFDSYYKELQTAEKDFFDTVAADPSDTDAVNAALSQLNQYDSALSQQADIATANLQSVTTAAKALQTAAKKMD